ncbi:DUF2382 domain-containing protein [Alkalicoccus halolimnae]|uniref:DUF2382 domain-containing protein n=1 Tax=Alkalicoccus halolimnae TaxID=1667239 RepID=A0A5C7F5M3_9BACI|nr:DUF2382 domain-containing protein [Alkalicoccus halolimnae]TXF85353.1 DUF2382 domain-containing protein [Alkalicoccus halolimnae]
MSNKVVGVYETEAEVVEAVNRVKQEGYTPESISILANEHQETALIKRETDVDIETRHQGEEGKEEGPGLLEKVKAAFTGNGPEETDSSDYKSRLKDLGLSDSEVEKQELNIKNGKIVVLAPDIKPGRHPDDTAAGAGIGTEPADSHSSASSDLKAPGLDDSPYAKEEEVETPLRGEGTHRAGDPLKDPNKAETLHGTSSRSGEKTDEEQKVRLWEEDLEVEKEEVQAGEAHVKKTVHEETKNVEVPVSREELHVERRPVSGEEAHQGAEGEFKEEEIHIPLKEEKVEVTKKPVVKEEVKIRKDKVEETEHAAEEVKREQLDISEDKRDDSDRR